MLALINGFYRSASTPAKHRTVSDYCNKGPGQMEHERSTWLGEQGTVVDPYRLSRKASVANENR